MTSRTLARVVTPNSIALNAYIYGYAGHSLVTPHQPLQQIWWTQERIDARVTPEFVASRLRKEERDQLQQSVGFGDCALTDDSYLEWILERARRLFLVLAEVGVPDQIFGVIDDSWDDEDLPIPLHAVERLALSYNNDDRLNRRFYHTQFTFLLRELHRRDHIRYGENEVIPLEYVYKLPAAVSLQNWSRVHFPTRPDEVFVRRRMSLDGESADPEADFLRDVETAQAVEHDHIAPVWATYTVRSSAFVVTPFVGHHTLKTFIEHRSAPQYMRLSKHDRHALLLRWLHCLADAVAALHRNNLCHGEIRPSNILIDNENNIAFSDIGTLRTFQRDKKVNPEEMYTYAPPEAHAPALAFLLDTTSPDKLRDRASRPTSVHSKTSSQRSFSPSSLKSTSTNYNSRRKAMRSLPSSPISSFDFGFGRPLKDLSPPTPLNDPTPQADIFALGCIFLDILTFFLAKKTAAFTKHRSSKHKTSPPSDSTGRRRSSTTTRLDASFHANLDHLTTWMALLDDAAFEKEDALFRAVPPLLDLVKRMLSPIPGVRPAADDVVSQVRGILQADAGMSYLHCGIHDHAHASPRTFATVRAGAAGRAERPFTAGSDEPSIAPFAMDPEFDFGVKVQAGASRSRYADAEFGEGTRFASIVSPTSTSASSPSPERTYLLDADSDSDGSDHYLNTNMTTKAGSPWHHPPTNHTFRTPRKAPSAHSTRSTRPRDSVVDSLPSLDSDTTTVADTATLRHSVADSVGESVGEMEGVGGMRAWSWRRKSGGSGKGSVGGGGFLGTGWHGRRGVGVVGEEV